MIDVNDARNGSVFHLIFGFPINIYTASFQLGHLEPIILSSY